MAECPTILDENILSDVKKLLWGNDLRDDVFSRWTQGFIFGDHETTALVQYEGGPCAVIAPVQAFVIKNIYFSDTPKHDLNQISGEEASELLLRALGDIMVVISSGKFCVLSLDQTDTLKEDPQQAQLENEEGESSCKRSRLDQQLFHSRLRCTECEDEESMRKTLKMHFSHFTDSSGVLLYLYSILLTKCFPKSSAIEASQVVCIRENAKEGGVDQVKNEVEDPTEPLIDGLHGHGSQSLINLLISGRAVTNVWDNDKDVSGLKLHGVSKRAVIGFLTYMEHLRYCEVGWHLKNPLYPIWLIGSETHLTVLFSNDCNLVINESNESIARRIFQRFDPEGNGFIATTLLGDLMSALDLVSEKEYVDIMVTKLDSENLGIITRSMFMEEFFAGEKTPEVPKSFMLYHYNGLSRSCRNNEVKFLEGSSVIQDELEVQILTDVSQIKMVLLTKWPTIEIKWTNEQAPSIN